MATKTLPPGPPGRFLLGHLGELRRDVLSFYTRVTREHGDVALLKFGLKPVYLVNHPDLIDQILSSRNFIKHYALRMNKRLLGNGLLSSEGDFWLRQRRLMQPAFSRDMLNGYGSTMVAYSERWAGVWKDGETRNVHADMRSLTMEIAAKTLFGADVEGQGPVVAQALIDVMESFSSRLFSVLRLPESFPTPRNIRAARAVKRLDAILYGLIDARRKAGGEQDDLLSLLLQARDDDDAGMTDQQLRDEAMTLFLAGHETTALVLTYTLWLLGRHSDIQDQLRSEIKYVVGDGPLTAAHATRLAFTEWVVLEGMRLYPPAYAIGRQAIEPCDVGGYRLPAGATVLSNQWVVHRDPRWWDRPEEFDPSRWSKNSRQRTPRCAYFPFGGGPRVCIGNTFAMIETVLVLAALLRRWRVESVTQELTFRPRMTLAPAAPVEVRLSRC